MCRLARVLTITSLSTLFGLAGSALAGTSIKRIPTSSSDPAYSRGDAVCTPQENWKIGRGVTAEWLRNRTRPPQSSEEATQLYRQAVILLNATPSPEEKALAHYWIGRSLFTLGLIRTFQQSLQDLLPHYPAPTAHGVRIAALTCLVQLRTAYPSLRLKPEIISRALAMPLQSVSAEDRNIYWKISLLVAEESLRLPEHQSTPLLQPALTLQKFPGAERYALLTRTWMAARAGNDLDVIRNGSAFLKLPPVVGSPPETDEWREKKSSIRLLVGQAYHNQGKYKEAIIVLRGVPAQSSVQPEVLGTLAWSYLLNHEYENAMSAAYNFLVGGLKHAYAPDAASVAAISSFENCHYPDAVNHLNAFKKSYLPTYRWLYGWNANRATSPKDLYQVLQTQLSKKDPKFPELLLTQWLHDSNFYASQKEMNLVIDEKEIAQRMIASLRNTPKKVPHPLLPTLQKILAETPSIQDRLTQAIRRALENRSQLILRQIAGVMDNNQKIQIEIYNAAGEDMVETNARPQLRAEAKKVADSQPKRAHLTGPNLLNFGRFPADESQREAEIWDDEIGSLKGDVSNLCIQE